MQPRENKLFQILRGGGENEHIKEIFKKAVIELQEENKSLAKTVTRHSILKRMLCNIDATQSLYQEFFSPNGTALNLAVDQNLPACLKILIDAKAEVNHNEEGEGLLYGSEREHNCTPLMRAVLNSGDWIKRGYRDWLPIINVLLEAKADVNGKGKNGYTALMIASIFGDKKCVEILLKAKADVNCKHYGFYYFLGRKTALDLADRYNHGDCVGLLLKAKNAQSMIKSFQSFFGARINTLEEAKVAEVKQSTSAANILKLMEKKGESSEKISPAKLDLNVYSNNTLTYLLSFKGRPKNSDILNELKLSNDEKQKFSKALDAVTKEIPNIPVKLHGKIYDLDTVLAFPNMNGLRLNTNVLKDFTLQNVEPDAATREFIQITIEKIRKARIEVAPELTGKAEKWLLSEPDAPGGPRI